MMRLRTSPDFYFIVPGTGEEAYYDVRSNVRYGFVGMAAGFKASDLEEGAASVLPGAGKTDAGDRVSVRQGIEMFKKYGTGMTQEQFHQGMLDAVAAMRGTDQVKPAIGP
ncbi:MULTISPECIES: polymorphic toxin type 44 domain-containing protein [Streptomyces]